MEDKRYKTINEISANYKIAFSGAAITYGMIGIILVMIIFKVNPHYIISDMFKTLIVIFVLMFIDIPGFIYVHGPLFNLMLGFDDRELYKFKLQSEVNASRLVTPEWKCMNIIIYGTLFLLLGIIMGVIL